MEWVVVKSIFQVLLVSNYRAFQGGETLKIRLIFLEFSTFSITTHQLSTPDDKNYKS